MKDEVPKHINKLSKGNIFLCTHLVTTKVHTMVHSCIVTPFDSLSEGLICWSASFVAVLRYRSRFHSTVRKTSFCEFVAFQGIFFHIQRAPLYLNPWCIQRSYRAAPYLKHSSLPFSSERKTWGCGIRNTHPSLFHHFLLRIAVPTESTPLGTAEIHYVVRLWTMENQSIFLICPWIHNTRGKKKVSSKVNR